jgi:hypothetical protein
MPTNQFDLSNFVTAVVIILAFALSGAAVFFTPAKKEPKRKITVPIIPPAQALIEMRDIIDQAQTIGDMLCIEALKAQFKIDYKDVYTEGELADCSMMITEMKRKKCMLIWNASHPMNLLSSVG